ncbi:SDR family NAD(P)-dependent oxidoreductase, partial [Clostridium perfringens]
MAKPLEGQNALVTGASRGIGRSIALALAEAGANGAGNYAGNEQAAAGVVAEIEALGVKAYAVKAHVGNSEQFEGMVKGVLDAWGKIDILVNNAGIT